MNTTVGPLPPAVYWRRRAIVAAPVVAILLTFTACMVTSGGSDDDNGSTLVARTGSPAIVVPSATDGPSVPGGSDTATTSPAPAPTSAAPATSAAPVAPAPSTAPASAAECGTGDLGLAAVLAQSTYTVGQYPKFRLVVTNVSSRACYRDLGGAQQELKVTSGRARIWSSDDCGGDNSRDRRLLQPGEKRTYFVVWNGRLTTPDCAGTRTQAEPGTYHLVARLGTIVSSPGTFTITR